MSKYTEGPWYYDKEYNRIMSSKEWFIEPSEDLDGVHTTVIETFGAMGGNDTAADIALICAAPELLALAKAILFDPYALTPDQWASEARAAMAGITGGKWGGV